MFSHTGIESLPSFGKFLDLVGLLDDVHGRDVVEHLHVEALHMICARYADEGQVVKDHSRPIGNTFTDEEVASFPGPVQVMQASRDHLAGGVLVEVEARLTVQRNAYLMLAILLAIRCAVPAHLHATHLAPVWIGVDIPIAETFSKEPLPVNFHILRQV